MVHILIEADIKVVDIWTMVHILIEADIKDVDHGAYIDRG